ncbi:MAG: hypothetical protein UU25_C0001G0031 [Microgenomates group bacterium GW2011_GWB1_40_9]|nr:MAG: hypothetical protein UT26_C0005G0020 [Microgenomates group bacterium GW2011_GWC1_39_12]KKR80120.1 MAG: hypothetical protein UU25_C0001G0031 [Microgenomates group bacterium GW2011_GWB1_40_9]
MSKENDDAFRAVQAGMKEIFALHIDPDSDAAKNFLFRIKVFGLNGAQPLENPKEENSSNNSNDSIKG